MGNAKRKNLIWIAAIVFAGICGFNGVKAWTSLNAVAMAQATVSEGLQRYKQSYQAVAGSRDRWEKSYPKLNADTDMMGLVSHLRLEQVGLLTEVDSLALTKVDPVKQGDSSIGLTRICLANGSSDGGALIVISENYETLLVGIDSLSKRPDIQIANISLLGGEGAVASARLGDFCVLMRNS